MGISCLWFVPELALEMRKYTFSQWKWCRGGDKELCLGHITTGFLISIGTLTLVFQFHREELEGKPALPAGVVGDLEDAPRRLVVSQEDIQRVAEGLDTPSREQNGAGKCYSGGHSWPALSPGDGGGSLVLCPLCLECRKISARSQTSP